jgi:hypothetical protein
MQDDEKRERANDEVGAEVPAHATIRSIMEAQPLNPFVEFEFRVLSIRPLKDECV